jgi:deoxyribose-phosphate aldolase
MPTELPPLHSLIDHALLHPTLTDDEIVAGCQEALAFHVASVCVPVHAVPLAVAELTGTDVAVGTVIGFPHGSTATDVKVFETQWAVDRGATEIDVVVNIGKVLGGDWLYVEAELRAVAAAAKTRGAIVKVIVETDFVQRDEDKRRVCEIAARCQADFVKTSTGFGYVKQPSGDYNYRGATPGDIQLFRRAVPTRVGVKASGGIRSREQAALFQQLGATRIGTSATRAICESQTVDSASY